MNFHGQIADYALIIHTRYMGPTNTRGARIVANFEKTKVSIPYGDPHTSGDAHMEAAKKCLQRVVGDGWDILYTYLAYGDNPSGSGYAFVFQRKSKEI